MTEKELKKLKVGDTIWVFWDWYENPLAKGIVERVMPSGRILVKTMSGKGYVGDSCCGNVSANCAFTETELLEKLIKETKTEIEKSQRELATWEKRLKRARKKENENAD